MVVWADEETRLLTTTGESDIGSWHATVHRDLMVHARPSGSKSSDAIRLLDPPDLADLPIPVLHVETAPERFQADAGKQQSSWEGAVILTALPDDRYEAERTALTLDLWAVPSQWAVAPYWEDRPEGPAAKLLPTQPLARRAFGRSRRVFGPVPSTIAFSPTTTPACAFYFSYWWV